MCYVTRETDVFCMTSYRIRHPTSNCQVNPPVVPESKVALETHKHLIDLSMNTQNTHLCSLRKAEPIQGAVTHQRNCDCGKCTSARSNSEQGVDDCPPQLTAACVPCKYDGMPRNYYGTLGCRYTAASQAQLPPCQEYAMPTCSSSTSRTEHVHKCIE